MCTSANEEGNLLLCFGRRRLIEPGVVADFCRLITLSHEPR